MVENEPTSVLKEDVVVSQPTEQTQIKNVKSQKKKKKKSKAKQKNTHPEVDITKFMTDEEIARKLQEEEDAKLALQLSQKVNGETLHELKRPEHSKVILSFDTNFQIEPQEPEDFDFDEEDEEDEEDDYYADKIVTDFSVTHASANGISLKKFQPEKNQIMKHSGKIELGKFNMTPRVQSDLKTAERKEEKSRIRVKSIEDRATTEQVLDPRTRMILFKFLNSGHIDAIHGCVSTGKEANVYYATGPEGAEYAIKVYKTSILVFRDRDRYVTGEFRFRKGYSKHNPRKMVKVWAEKECRNLKRLQAAGILVPEAIHLRQHVLVMKFIGKNGWPAPRLKDANLSVDKLAKIYLKLVKMMRAMYHVAKLVHGDLSEYNILYYKGDIVIIDVSQSVEHDHPHALDFLRRDCAVIKEFFLKGGLTSVMTTKELFDFITDINLNEKTEDTYLERMMDIASNRILSKEDELDEEVFKKVYIPRTLEEVYDYEIHAMKDDEELKKIGETDKLHYRTITGLNPETQQFAEEFEEEEEEEEGEEEVIEKKVRKDPFEGMTKKERKQFVKEQKREKRKTKIPKKVKKRRILQTKGHKKKSSK